MDLDQLRHELNAKRLDELRGLARALQIPGYSSAPKAQLVERLIKAGGAELGDRLKARTASNEGRDEPPVYQAALWEKICVVSMALLVVVLVGFLVVRNEPFHDPNLVVLIRTVLSAAVAVLGATIPGFLHVNLSVRGLVVRAGGALALFVLTFFCSPNVLTTPAPPPVDSSAEKKERPQPPKTSVILEGSVTDAETLRPLSGVTLTIEDLDDIHGKTPTCTSDAAGRFRFRDLPAADPPRRVRLVAQKDGYQPSLSDPTLETTSHAVTLRPTPLAKDTP